MNFGQVFTAIFQIIVHLSQLYNCITLNFFRYVKFGCRNKFYPKFISTTKFYNLQIVNIVFWYILVWAFGSNQRGNGKSHNVSNIFQKWNW